MEREPKRPRIRLNLESLEVDTFDTLPAESQQRGTVRAFWTRYEDSCPQTWCDATCESGCVSYENPTACGASCGFPCDTVEWQETCLTCRYTCSPACRSADGYASCGGSCDETNCPGEGNCSAYPCYME